MKTYNFTEQEHIIIRDALIEFKHSLPKQSRLLPLTAALADQLKENVRLHKGL